MEIIHASCEGNLELMRDLIEKGYSVNYEDNNGYTALTYASIAGRLDMVELLIENNAEIEHLTSDGMTAISLTKRYSIDCVEIVKLLERNIPKIISRRLLSIYSLDFELGFCVLNEFYPERFSERERFHLS